MGAVNGLGACSFPPLPYCLKELLIPGLSPPPESYEGNHMSAVNITVHHHCYLLLLHFVCAGD